MTASNRRAPLETPDRLGAIFSILAGAYVALLITPVLVLGMLNQFQLDNELLAIGILGSVGAVITAGVAWYVTHQGKTVLLLNRSGMNVLLPLAGLVPILAYWFSLIEYAAYRIVAPEAAPVESLIGVVGFLFGIVAVFLGEILVSMARNRVADRMVDESAIDLEWKAGWTRVNTLKWFFAITACYGVFAVGVIAFLGWTEDLFSTTTASIAVISLMMVGMVTRNMSEKRIYRITPAGLEQHESRWSRLFTPWADINGFSVTDRTIVLHRNGFRPDIRFSRRDVRYDEKTLTGLQQNIKQ